MEPIPARAELAIRRSRVRARVLICLASLGECYLGQLARVSGVDRSRIAWILHGRMPYYKPELSLVPLGLAEVEMTSTGRVYRITRRGLRHARSLTSRRKKRRIEWYT